MKKTNATLIMAGLVILCAVSWFSVFRSQTAEAKSYSNYIETARNCYKKEIYVDAVSQYKKALEINTQNYELTLELADAYYKLGDTEDFIKQCSNAIAIDNSNEQAYLKLTDYYINNKRYKAALDLLKKATKVKNREQIDSLLGQLKYQTQLQYVSGSEVGNWHNGGSVNLVSYKYKDKWGIITSAGKKLLKPQYDYIGAYDVETGILPCSINGEYYYINSEGYKKLVGDEKYEYLGSFGNGLAPAKRNGMYGYINTKFEEKNFEYEYAGAFANNVAAVKHNGKWGLIDKNLKMVTGFDYDGILVDSDGFCSLYNVIVAVQNGKYVFINKEGKKVSDNQYEEAKMQASEDGAIAVKINGKWGFADSKGNKIIDGQYEDAESFSLGLAPVKKNSDWGYINLQNEMVINADYTHAGVFCSDGTALIQQGELWNIITLYEYTKK